MLLYRADSRTRAEMNTKFPHGFAPYCTLSVEQIRKVLKCYTGSKDTKGLPDHLVKGAGLNASPNLLALSTYIKYTKNKTETIWVSTATNKDCGGQGGGFPIYEFSIDLTQYTIVNRILAKQASPRNSGLKPTLLMDGASIDASSSFGINHGPLSDPEISMFTAIPLSAIQAVH